jgi:hypothetical protein
MFGPAYYTFDGETIERDAFLFVAGSYPDKGVEITEGDLDNIIKGTVEAPLKIAHKDTAFDGSLGKVSGLYRKGKELWGRVQITKEAWALCQKAGAKMLSVGIPQTKDRLSEASIVKTPRIAGASFFTFEDGNMEFYSELEESIKGGEPEVTQAEFEQLKQDVAALRADVESKDKTITEQADQIKAQAGQIAQFSALVQAMDGKNNDLQFELKKQAAEAKVNAAIQAGKLLPAQADMAISLLCSGDQTIKFGETDTTPAALFEKMLESSGKVLDFDEQGKNGDKNKTPEIKFSGDTAERLGLPEQEEIDKLAKKYNLG